MIQQLSTEQLLRLKSASDVAVIDVRSPDAYNGWRLRSEPRGGHIPGARSLPAKWLRYIDWIEIVRNKQIRPEQQLVIYGYDADQSRLAAKQFERAGYERICVYEGFTAEWTANDELPLAKLPRYRQLVPPEWLSSLIRTGAAPEYDNDKFVVCHVHYRNHTAYDEGHIPGAISVDTNWLESPQTWNLREPDELKAALEGLGITHDRTVVLYGRFSYPNNSDPFPGSSAGHLGAMRCAFIMLAAGVKDVRVLNGGLGAWEDAGYAVTTEAAAPKPAGDFGVSVLARPELVVSLEEAQRILVTPGANLVSVRSWEEYIGRVSGYNYINVKGRIPGSVFAECGSDAYHMENYRNLDHTMREYEEIEALWAEAGITAEQFNAFYCGTGWRGSEAFWAAWLMSWPRAAVFDGGWFEWTRDGTNPIETGMPTATGAI